MNLKIVFNAILALIFLVLTFTVDWLFIIGAVVLIYINQKILIGKSEFKKSSKKII